MKLLVRSPENEKEKRKRPEDHKKNEPMILLSLEVLDQRKKDFADESGAYGLKWAKVFKDDEYAIPSYNEMMEGILEWYVKQ